MSHIQIFQQREKIAISDIQTLTPELVKHPQKNGKLLPNNIRCIIVGSTNAGKTNVVFNLLFDSNGLSFSNIYVFSKSLYQPKYKMLQKLMSSVPEIGYFPFHENEEVIAPEDAEPYSIMIFDDVSCERQNNIRNYFAMGRHNNIDSFYLCQTYSRVPKQLVRDNANMIVLFKQDELNLRHIFNDHVNTDMSFNTFRKVCAKAWNEKKYGFLVIDKDSDMHKGRYRIGFDRFLLVDMK